LKVKLGVLFSGGKDSTYALHKAMQSDEVACLITIVSSNPESFMYHTPNIDVTQLQAEALGLPFVKKSTEGAKEEELSDLESAIASARDTYCIEGVVSGAIESVYQAQRIEAICDRLALWCFNPLWKCDQVRLLHELVDGGFKAIISGVFAYPMGEEWLGKEINDDTISRLIELKDRYQISPSGEGGELETTVLDAPLFKRRIDVQEYEIKARNNSGTYIIKKARLVGK
jgi:diphthine-ammonia ligase